MPVMLRSVKRLGWSLLVCAAAAPAARAFNADAHRVVGHVAATQVCATTLDTLRALDPERDLAAAGTWADEIRGLDEWDRARPWHFINVPDTRTVAELMQAQPEARNVVWAIERFSRVLADTAASPTERLQAYRFVVHFVADVHQPLHVGRQSDLGGNRVKVVARGGARMNLHRYWDGAVLGSQLRPTQRYAQRLVAGATPGELRRWRAGGPVEWAAESQAYRAAVYAFAPATSGQRVVLDDAYGIKAKEIIDLRILQAGVRLAALLDKLFCASAVP
ncbi:MAG: S1/P1 nuclease [Gammaproteobacteria bacterium]|jgi:hypothetical protein|nr:S1/P1 nuclease [Gammaproteobacteria bacterium]